MRILDIMHREVVTIGPDETLAEPARVMRQHGISAVVVSEGEAPVGILTERDFVQGVVDGDDPATRSSARRASKMAGIRSGPPRPTLAGTSSFRTSWPHSV
jgi:CBS domain-containing protein